MNRVDVLNCVIWGMATVLALSAGDKLMAGAFVVSLVVTSALAGK